MLDDLPGFRRRIRIAPGKGAVVAALEDDFHRMTVTLHHDGERITGAEPLTERAPWDSCPGAGTVLRRSFTGLALDQARVPAEKPLNCTHLYDLAVLAGAHARDDAPLVYDVLVSDSVAGVVFAEVRRDGASVLLWRLLDDVLAEPADIAGTHLMKLRGWIGSLDGPTAEAARILQWASLIAHGRTLPPERQSDASKMPPSCYSFQPEQAAHARRIGERVDFTASGASRQPLDG